MNFLRFVLALTLVVSLVEPPLHAQKKKKKTSDEEGMVLEVNTNPKKKKKGEDDMTQTLPPPKEAPSAVVADTDKLFFQVSTLSSKGLLSAQTREAMRGLLRSSHGTGIVKLRAFVAGSGDMRRILEIAGEVFTEKHLPLPALTVVQAGALPMEGAQVVIESIGVDKKSLNPSGVAFLAGQQASSVEKSVDKLQAAFKAGGMEATDILKVTCFVSSLEESNRGKAVMESAFSGAALNLVQMQRLPVSPTAECEGVARLRTPGAVVSGLTPVRAPRVVLSSMQMAFGHEDADVKLAFERLRKALSAQNATTDHLAMAHVYLTSTAMAAKVRALGNLSTATTLPIEALPSLDASFGIDVVAVPQ